MKLKIYAYLVFIGYPIITLVKEPTITSFIFLLTTIMIITIHYNMWEHFLKNKIENTVEVDGS